MLAHAIGPRKDTTPKDQVHESLCEKVKPGDFFALPHEPGRVTCPDCLNKMALNRKR